MQIDNLELSDEQKRCMLSTTTRSKYSLLGQNLEATTPLPAAHEAGDLVRRNNKRAHSGDQEAAGSRVVFRFQVAIGGRGFLIINQRFFFGVVDANLGWLIIENPTPKIQKLSKIRYISSFP